MCTLGVYEKAMPLNLTWEQKLQYAKQAGFDRVEISIDETDDKLSRLYTSEENIMLFTDLQHKAGIKVDTMCLSGHRRYPLGSHIKETREKGMEIMCKARDFAYTAGIRIIQLAGYDVYYNEQSDSESKGYFVENIYKSVKLAASKGVILAFETMENDFMNTVEKASVYVKQINSPYLKIYPDIGNISNGTENVLQDIEKGRGNIVAAHLKETKPGVFRNMRFGEGKVNFKESINKLREMGVGMYTAEFWYDDKRDFKDELVYAKSFLTPYLTEV